MVIKYKVKGKDIPVLAQTGHRRLQDVEAPRIFRHSAHEGGNVVSPTHRPPLPFPPKKDLRDSLF